MEQSEKVLNEIVINMPKGLTDMQKVRFIYLEVCRFFVYNLEYIIGNDKKKAELFDLDININEITNNRGVCSSISRALIYLLEQCNIQCNGVYFDGRQEGHMEVLFSIDGKVYQLDPARDLMNVKMGYETTGFAMQMKSSFRNEFNGYSYLKQEEIKELDDVIGYTYGISKEYIEEQERKGKNVNKLKERIYMNEAVEAMGEELYDMQYLGEYIKSNHPDINIDILSAHELDNYRIEFIMNYVNSFAAKYSYIEKRDFFESLITGAIFCSDGNPKLFSGECESGELMTILKYEGDIAEENLFYLIRDGQDIVKLSESQVQEHLDNGFKTISGGKEQFIINHDKNFQKLTHKFNRKLNQYVNNCTDLSEKQKRDNMVCSAILLQKCNTAISNYMELVYKSMPQQPEHNPMVKQLYSVFMAQVKKYEYDKYLPKEDLSNEAIGIKNFLKNMQIIKSILEGKAEPVLKMISEYKQELKSEVKDKNILLYHVSTVSPDKLRDGELKPMYNKSQYHQDFGKIICASTADLSSNAYIMSRVNGKGMYRLPIGKNSYMLEGNNVEIAKDERGQARATSKIPGYIYYVAIDNFEPVVHLRLDIDRNEYIMEFDDEWTSDRPVKIPEHVASRIREKGDTVKCPADADTSEVYAIEKYNDVTSVLEHNQIIVNMNLEKSDLQYITNNCFGNTNIRKVLLDYIRDGRIRYLNGEAGINEIKVVKNIQKEPKLVYDGHKIVEGPSIKTPEEVRCQKIKIRDFLQNAIKNGITYGEYMQIVGQSQSQCKSDKFDILQTN